MRSTELSDWTLAIDYGTSYTAAAVGRGSEIELLYFNGVPRLPSLVLRNPDGTLLVGTTAEHEGQISPDRLLRAPKRRLGDRIVLLGGAPLAVVDAVSAVLAAVLEEAQRQQGGTSPSRLVMTHPARWGSERLNALREAARGAGLPEPDFVAEPVAAALHYMGTGETPVESGQRVAIYDLGGGTFDTAVLERRADGGFSIVAIGGNEYLGGEDFDEIVYRHLGNLLAEGDAQAWEQLRHSEERPWKKANAEFRHDVRQLKEDLSTSNARSVYVRYPADREQQLTRPELEVLLRQDLDRTLDELAATIQRAGSEPKDLAAIYLVGGSSRIRLLPQLVRERFGRVDTRDDPKAVVVLGAARAPADATPPLLTPAPMPPETAEPLSAPDAPLPPPTPPGGAATSEPKLPAPRLSGRAAIRRIGPVRLTAIALVAATLVVLALFATGIFDPGVFVGDIVNPSDGVTPSASAPSSIDGADLVVGDCFSPIDGGFLRVSVVPCTEPHTYEVYHAFEYPNATDAYPGDEGFEDNPGECPAEALNFLGVQPAEVGLEAILLVPLEDQWPGDRTVTCTLKRLDGAPMTGSQRRASSS